MLITYYIPVVLLNDQYSRIRDEFESGANQQGGTEGVRAGRGDKSVTSKCPPTNHKTDFAHECGLPGPLQTTFELNR